MCQLTVNWAFMLLSAERAMMIYDADVDLIEAIDWRLEQCRS